MKGNSNMDHQRQPTFWTTDMIQDHVTHAVQQLATELVEYCAQQANACVTLAENTPQIDTPGTRADRLEIRTAYDTWRQAAHVIADACNLPTPITERS